VAWGLGWQVGADFALGSRVSVGVAYERTQLDDVITVPSGSYVTLYNIRTSQVVGRLSIRP
jgi:opacity protein-like surface antigen